MRDLDRLNDRQGGLSFACGMLIFAGAILVERFVAGARFDVVDAWLALAVIGPQLAALILPVRRWLSRVRMRDFSAVVVLANGLLLAVLSIRHTTPADGLPYMVEMLLIQTVFAYIYSGLTLRAAVACGSAMGGAYLLGLFLADVASSSALVRTALVVVALNAVGSLGRLWTSKLIDYYQQARAELAYEAAHDPLTDLMNRRGLLAVMEQRMRHATREQLSVGLVYLDLDGFKHVNDNFGHAMGDQLLVDLGRAFKAASRRPMDAAIRMGGDEFLLVWPVPNARRLLNHAEELLDEIRSIGEGLKPGVTASIGLLVVHPGEDSPSAEALIHRAEALAMGAKRSGGNQITAFGIGPQQSAASA